MTDLISSDWKELDADNTQPSPNGVQGGYSPSQVAPIIRSIRGSLKRFYNQTNAVYTTTGSATAYVLTFEAAPAGYSKGIIYRFWAHATNTGAATLNINSLGSRAIVSGFDGSPLIAGQIVSGHVAEVVFNGTAFELISTGMIADERLPSTMSGKSFTSSVYTGNGLGNAGSFTTTSNGTTLSILRNNADAVDIEAFLSTNSATKHGLDLNRYGGLVTVGGSRVVTVYDYGAGRGLDADLLDGQHGSYYLARGNATGTQPIGTVSGLQSAIDSKLNLSGGSLSGGLSLISNGGPSGSAAPMFAIRNTGTGEALMSFGAAGRTTNLSTIGQLANGSTRIASNTKNWDFAPDGTITLPSSGLIGADGNLYSTVYGDWISNVIARAKNVRFGGVGWADLRSSGGIFDSNLAPNVLCGVTTNGGLAGDNRALIALFYRTIQQTDVWGNWYNVG
ncbi:hypothetical protein G6L16_021460 [Agrobacterium tumefaciens]|uniref:hypothetical protein n=1 Tax=Agrobacterium tumefaciens TaxID=358 RepID=UPI0015740AD2|nr:hypothetical protein [Agrobacterium tumefaciens]NSZ64609.1 hypothetical protein [Agrobacterium tumefaciens]NTA70979.1 hypothetical protein [Agrobacterium tumefaciens]WIE40768.1 hypothetical protein G6L16_021460 [Agrobacterium tumefaciens]